MDAEDLRVIDHGTGHVHDGLGLVATFPLRETISVVALVFAAGAACGDSPLVPLRPALTDLPDDLAEVTFAAEGALGVPYVMVELHGAGGFSGFVAINGAGEPVWYFRTEGGPLGFARRGNGNFVLLDTERGLVEVTPGGAVVHALAQQELPGRRIHHDVIAMPEDRVLFLALDCRSPEATLVCGEAVWEWEPETGTTVRRWSAFDHFDPALDRGERSTGDDWLHANSIARGARGNLLVSLHFLNQVISIAPDYASIEWRMGGTRGTIDVTDPFSGQHTAQESGPGRVLLFDNGFERMDERYSRAVEYAISGATAQIVWQWRPERDNWARVISGVRPLPDGNRLITFGTPAGAAGGATGPIEVYEVTRGGRVAWHVVANGPVSALYRATPLEAF